MAQALGTRLVEFVERGGGQVGSGIKLPIVVVDSSGGDPSTYQSTEEAELQLEPTDVLNNEYVAYDSEGRLLHLTVARDRELKGLRGLRRLFGWLASRERVRVRPGEVEPAHASELRQSLARSLVRIGVSEDFVRKASLEDLVAEVQKRRR